MQFAEFLAEPVERVGGVPVAVAGSDPDAHVGAPRVVEFLGTAAGPTVRAQRVQHLPAVVVQFGEGRQPISFVADGAQVSR